MSMVVLNHRNENLGRERDWSVWPRASAETVSLVPGRIPSCAFCLLLVETDEQPRRHGDH